MSEFPEGNENAAFPGTGRREEVGRTVTTGAGGGPPPGRRGRKAALWIAVGVAVVILLAGAGVAVDRLVFDGRDGDGPSTFQLDESKSFREALFNIESYFYRDASAEELTEAAEAAVEEARRAGESDPDILEETALRALAAALDDPHTSYLTREENRRLNEDISGSFYGVGFMLRVDEEEERPKVFSVIKDSPSDRAGVRKDDIIVTVDGEGTQGLNLDVVVSRIRGEKGTPVELGIKREGISTELVFSIEREKIEIPELEPSVLEDRYGYLNVFNFNSGIGEKIREGVRDMLDQGVRGFILDVRNNPGGLLDEAVKVTSAFMEEGVVVSYKTKGDKKVDEPAAGDPETDLPLVVLINGGSASSSEITAGALQDSGRAVLVGTRTYGKGSVQKIYQLANGGAVKLTISMYLLPDGESIDGTGIEADIQVEYPDDLEREEELQFEKAKEVLENLIQGKPASGGTLGWAA